MQVVDPKRLQLWQALSEFFLDTELTDTTIAYIARVIQETGYSYQEVHTILWGEVFPGLKSNMLCVAGEWAGWPDEWLLKRLRVRTGPVKRPRGFIAAEIDKCWQQVLAQLPPDFAGAAQ